jgi:peptidoglycan/xylan/chitin deacetylase (PgdA/CDA1 family)
MAHPYPTKLDPEALTSLPRDFVGYGQHTPDPKWPNDIKVAINLVVNYEEGAEYSLLDGDDSNDAWGEYTYEIAPTVRDLSTETHMEFGSRVGIWRLARLLDEYKVDATFDACALALERNPEFSSWIRERSHDVIGHGWRWTEDSRLTRDEEQRLMRRAITSIEETTGQRIRGWVVRSFPSVNTRSLLVEDGGFLYDSDASNDELPYFVEQGGKPFLVVPYSKVYNDVKYFVAPILATPNDFFTTLKLAVDYLVDEAERGYGGRMMTVGLHARWSGQAARASAVRSFIEYVLAKDGAGFMRRLDIAEHWMKTFPPSTRRAQPHTQQR